MTGVAYHDGDFVEPTKVRIAPVGSGWLLGDGLFETLLVCDGRAVDVGAHLERLRRGLRLVQLSIPESDETLSAAVDRVAAGGPRPHARLRITLSRGAPGCDPTRLVTAAPYERPASLERETGVRASITPATRISSRDPLSAVKSASYQRYLIAYRAARAEGAYEALLLNEHDHVVEGSRSNLLVRFDDEVVTPPLTDGCLPGTVRRRLLECGAVIERTIHRARLDEADELMLSSSLIGILPVSQVDGRELPPGPAAAALNRVWEEAWVEPD